MYINRAKFLIKCNTQYSKGFIIWSIHRHFPNVSYTSNWIQDSAQDKKDIVLTSTTQEVIIYHSFLRRNEEKGDHLRKY